MLTRKLLSVIDNIVVDVLKIICCSESTDSFMVNVTVAQLPGHSRGTRFYSRGPCPGCPPPLAPPLAVSLIIGLSIGTTQSRLAGRDEITRMGVARSSPCISSHPLKWWLVLISTTVNAQCGSVIGYHIRPSVCLSAWTFVTHWYCVERSTYTNLSETLNDWILVLQYKGSLTVNNIDFSKTFDSVSHNFLSDLRVMACVVVYCCGLKTYSMTGGTRPK